MLKGIAHRLTRDVPNPKPDRRSTSWESRPVWKEGLIFYLRTARNGVEMIDRGGVVSLASASDDHERARFDALRAALEPLPNAAKDVAIVIYEQGCSEHYIAETMLTGLVRSGKVTLADLAIAFDEEEAAAAERDQKGE